jgi:hypothetical protein
VIVSRCQAPASPAVSLRRIHVRQGQACAVSNDNDPAPAEQRDIPGGEAAQEAQRSWVTVLANDANEVAVGAAIMGVGYGAKKIADKIRKPPAPPSADGSDSDSEA